MFWQNLQFKAKHCHLHYKLDVWNAVEMCLSFSMRPSSVSIAWLPVSHSPAWLCAIVSRISGRDEASHPFASEKIEGANILQVLPSSHVVTWSDHFHKRIHSLHQRFEMSSRRLAEIWWHLGAANKWCGSFRLIFLRNSGLGNWWDAAIWFFNRHDFTVTRHDENSGMKIVARIICTNTKLIKISSCCVTDKQAVTYAVFSFFLSP